MIVPGDRRTRCEPSLSWLVGTSPAARGSYQPGENLSKRLSIFVVSVVALLALPAAASAKDYADTALNIIPSGQLQPGEPPAPMPNDA